MKKLIATLTAALSLTAPVVIAAPVSAGEVRWCQEEGNDCPKIYTQLHIAERERGSGRFQTVTVTAENTNHDTPSGILDAQLVVTYQAARLSSVPRQKIVTLVPDGNGTFTASFEVRRFRHVDGVVTASIEDVLCDTVNETVGLS